MKCYSLVIDPKLVKEIDRLVREHGLFSSRSDFIRDAIRARLFEVKKTVIGNKEKLSRKELEREERLVDETMEYIDDYKFGGVH